jgi:hypothetical protein
VPAPARFGLFLLAFGLLADLAFHASGNDGYPAHVLVFVGMLLVVGGVVYQGLRCGTHPLQEGKSHVDAHR